MKKLTMLLLAVFAVACGGEVQAGDVCYTEPARAFLAGSVECVPLESAGCGFGVHNQAVELSSESPVSYWCSCNSAGRYSCFGSPSLPPAEPLK